MNREEMEIEEGMRQAKLIAMQMGEALVNQVDSSRVAVYASAIVYAGMCSSAGVSMHTAVDLFMTIFKDMQQFEEGTLQ